MPKATPATLSVKLVKASARHLRVAPRKIRLVANLVKGMNVLDALVQLDHTPKKSSGMVVKLLKSAIANAKNNFSMEPEKLFIQSLTVDMGQVMKRYFPRARGSAFVIRRKTSHLNVVLAEREGPRKARRSKIELFKKKEQPAEEKNLDQLDSTNKKPVQERVKQQVVKTQEQIKTQNVQQKRRLFNRKSGE